MQSYISDSTIKTVIKNYFQETREFDYRHVDAMELFYEHYMLQNHRMSIEEPFFILAQWWGDLHPRAKGIDTYPRTGHSASLPLMKRRENFFFRQGNMDSFAQWLAKDQNSAFAREGGTYIFEAVHTSLHDLEVAHPEYEKHFIITSLDDEDEDEDDDRCISDYAEEYKHG